MSWPKLTSSFLTLLRLVFMTGTLVAAEATPFEDFTATPGLESGPEARLSGGQGLRAAAASEVPPLAITRDGEKMIVTWPWPATGWVLEQSPGLDPAASWTRLAPALFQVTGTNTSITVSPPAGTMFYRLRKLRPSDLVPGLTGGWTLDEGQGETAGEASGSTATAFLANAVWMPGRIGASSLWFDGGSFGAGGSRAWVSNANYALLPPSGQPFSVSFWFNADVLTNGWSGLMGNDANGSNGWHVALSHTGPGTNDLIFAATGTAGSLSVSGRKLLLPGQWYQLTAIYDGSEGRICLDGELLAQGAGSIPANNEPVYFGGGVGGYPSFRGRIDEVRTFTRALTAEDISLAGDWGFDENGGTFSIGRGVQGRHATLSNPASAWVSGKEGSGIDLSHNTVVIPNDWSEVLPPTGGPFSVSFWLRPNSIPSGWSGLMSCADGTNTGWNLALYAEGPGQTRLHWCSTNTGGTLDLYASVSLAEDVWSKLDLTYNGGIATLYINGRNVRSDSGGIQGSTASIVLGAVAGMANFNGAIDELKIYRRERSEAEIGPVAKVMWETALVNRATNLVLQGFGPAGKPLTYSIVDTVTPTNGTVLNAGGLPMVTYLAGARRGPDAFTYTVSDGEFTSPPTIVVVSVVQPHWLSPNGGSAPLLDGTSPDQAWVAGPAEDLDAIWKTNQYYDCFYYAPGDYQTTGWKYGERGTANPGCKHIGSGSEGSNRTTLRLVNAWDAAAEGLIFGVLVIAPYAFCHSFEVHGMVLDCNAANNPKYTVGEPISIVVPLVSTARVDTVTLHWHGGYILGAVPWFLGPADEFSVCARVAGAGGYVTNCTPSISMGDSDTVPVGVDTDEVILQLQRRASGVDFYSLAEIEVAGAAVSLPSATIPGGGESRLDTNSATYSIVWAVDGNDGTVWASGPEEQVRISVPLNQDTTVSQLNLFWNCHTVSGLGRLGPAADYRIQARDQNTQQFYDVPYVRQPRTASGAQVNTFGTAQTPSAIVTDQLVILLDSKELGVDFYSLREVRLQNGAAPVPLRIPSALNHLSWDLDYHILRAFDGDPNTHWTSASQGMVGALSAIGNNLKFTHLRVVGFGTKAYKECFPLGARTPPTGNEPVRFGNVLIEDCVFTDPAPYNPDGLTTVVVSPFATHSLTNGIIRRCTVSGLRSHFAISQAYSGVQVENCVASNCNKAVYFEPGQASWDAVAPVLIRSNQFLNVDNGVYLLFHPSSGFYSLTCLDNEIVLSGGGGWGLAACDVCATGPSGSITNMTALNNIVRYPDWSPRPAGIDGGLLYSDIRHAVFGNNVLSIGTPYTLRMRQCPAGLIPPPPPTETCDSIGPGSPPPLDPVYPPCLDVLLPGYRRAWFNNRDILGSLLKVRYYNTNSDGFASQQQWP